MEMLARREARAKEKEDRARELKEAREATAAANAAAAAAANERAAAIQAQSTEQMSVLQSQLQFLAAKIERPAGFYSGYCCVALYRHTPTSSALHYRSRVSGRGASVGGDSRSSTRR